MGNTADLELRIPATMAGPKRTDYAKGRLWATNQRVGTVVNCTDAKVIFIGDQPVASGSGSAPIASLVIPFVSPDLTHLTVACTALEQV